MKRPLIFLILLWGLALPAWAVDIAGTVNSYVKGDGDVTAGSTTINYTGSFRGASSAINAGNLLLLIQSQGALIDSSNTDTYGDGVGQGIDVSTTPTSAHGTPGYAGGLISQTAGTFEYATVASVNGSQITLTAPLEHAYYDANEANWQIVVVPDYGVAGARLTADITTVSWDGDSGGVIAFNATGGSIDFNGFNINAAGMGFRGGVDGDINSTTDNIANVVDVTSDLGGKGEGIAGTPRLVFDSSSFSIIDEGTSTLSGGDYGRGAPGNAGGGAGPHNSGGGGGSNAGRGGSGAQGWVGGTPEHYAGYGGQSIFAGANMGGGGGAGDSNNGSLTFGGLGGGVILLRADSGTGSGALDVRGEDAVDGTLTGQLDGAGGGGAGGTVITYFSSATTLAGLNIYASGGDGGDADPEHGGGGGGGGGLVMVNATVGTVDISGGFKGANEGINGGVPSEPGADGVAETSANAFVRLNTDYGDAPDSYGTISGGQGAYHFFADYDFNGILGATEQLRLGANLDGEGGGNPSTGANSDDSTGVDDEDGVTGLTQVDPQGSDYTISASSITVTNTLGSAATLHAWIDFDLNGTFDSDEYTSIPVASGLSGQNPASDLVWNTMPGITAVTPGSTTYLRLRLSTDSSLDATRATGEAANGEVEDYALTVYDAIPTAQNVTRSNPTASLTNANQLVFAVTFSESVQNVDTSDFSVSGAGSTGASVSAVSGSGSSYTVTVDVADTDGQVNLDIAATTGIQDLTGNNLSTVTPTGSVESYTLDNTAPVISLQGASPVNVILGGSYSDQGASALDDVDGDLTGAIATSGSVNTAAVGTYFITYNVSDAAGNAATPVTRTVTVAIGPASAGTSLISASPVAITADGSSTSTITVQLKDVNGNNLTTGGDTVALSTTAGTLGSVTDNGNGTYSATLTSSTTAGSATISGTVNAASITDNASVAFSAGAAAGSSSLISASPTSITADGSSTSTITVQLNDVNGNNLTTGGDVVTLSTTAGTLGSVTDNGNGTYSATLTSSTTAGSATISGSVNAASITDSASVAFSAGAAAGSSSLISASPTSITADGSSTSTITIQLNDVNGNNLTTGGDVVTLSTTAGTLGSVTDNGDGTYSATLTSSTTAGSGTISGSVNAASITDNASVTFTAGAAAGSSSLITASPTTITADGSSTSTITVQLKDVNGNDLTSGGDTVTLSTTAGTLGSVTDNGDGTYSATLTSSTTAGSATISGSVNAVSITDSASVTFTAGAASGSSSLITANPTSITADGSSTSTITVQLNDVNGNNLTSGGDTVALSTTAGTLGSVTDNGDGTYSATLTSSATAGSATISGSVNAASITDSVSVTFIAGAASGSSSLITANPTAITADGSSTSTITVQLKDGNGNDLASGGDVVTLSTTAGTLGSVTDNGDGTYSATLTSSTTTGTATISGSVNATSITDSASVTFTAGAASSSSSLIMASPTSITADGSSASIITVQLKDAAGNNLTSGGDVVVLSTTAGTLGSVADNGDGTYSATLTSSTSIETATISATLNSSPVSDTASVDFVVAAASANTSLISASPDSIIANGSSNSTITVQLKDAAGNNLTSGGDVVTLLTTAGNLAAVTDNGDGTYSATLTSASSAASASITGTVNAAAITDTETVTFTPDPSSDDDGDGIANGDEGTGDFDNDGVLDFMDLDSDNDGIPDAIEGNVDTDGDGIPDYLDLDSDNDGIYDLIESGADYATLDTLHDGMIDSSNPVGANGLADAVETSADSGTLNYNSGSPLDSDADGVEDFVDLDSDNDGLTDVIEAGGADPDADGIVGNGVPTVDAYGVATSGAALTPIDNDGDGVNDQVDLDSDNDGIMDVVESGGDDPDGDGQVGNAPAQVDSNGLSVEGSLTVLDTDGDGVPNQHDLDSDNDGIPDVTEAGADDADGDGIPGTGAPTVNAQGIANGQVLTPTDIDADSILDPYDLDSDGDGIYDLVEAGGTDSNNDGLVDGFSDSNGDGFDDGIAASALPVPDSDGDGIADYQDNDDADNDGIPDSVDIDDDNDGIPDALEGDGSIDTDNDGIPDSLDLDSDNDGLYDLYEAGLPNPASLDSNNDGRLDSSLSVGSNGLVDSLETSVDSGVINYNGGTALDTDADGVKDFRDLDSDNDSIPDVIESGGVDGDGDGVLGTGAPAVNSNGLATGAGSQPLDTDADGVPDQQDLDTDNDGIPDLQEVGASDSDNNGVVDSFVDSNGDGFNDVNATAPLTLPDTDGDGIPDLRDSAAANGVVSAGLNGIGAFNAYLLGLLGVLAGLRLIKIRGASLLSLLALLLSPAAAMAQQPEQPQDAYQQRFYIGAGLGRSTLQPSTSGSAYTLDDDSDSGHRFYGGLDLSESFSVELSLSVLGSADLKPTGKLDYSINAVNVLYYLYNQGEMEHVGMAAYLKAGLGKIDVSADIPYEVENSTQIALGAGLEYAWENGFAVRADLESFDEDASLLSVGLLYRFGKQQKPEAKDSDRDGVLDQNDQCPQTPLNAPVNAEGCQLDSDKDGVVDLLDQCPQTALGVSVDSKGCELDSDGDGVVNSQDQCPQTAAGIKVDVSGCALDSDKDGVIDSLDKCPDTYRDSLVDASGCPVPVVPIFDAPLEGVNFKVGSAELTNPAKLVLDDAAKLLMEFPTINIEIQAHTDSQGTQENNQKLSDLRAQSVLEYLQSKGIAAKRMTPVGFGESMPLMSNKTAEGRAKNRRVEFKVLQ